jgi:hypothetical protein
VVKSEGRIFYQDYTDTIYEVTWSTIGDVIDITTITRNPRLWGHPPEGFVRNGILFRKGIVTVNRQVLRPLASGYEIVAEGSSQYTDYIQMNYPCQEGPRDTFIHHLNYSVTDAIEGQVTDGPHWADPDEPLDFDMIWGAVDDSGDVLEGTGSELLEFIDVWA